MRAWMSLVLGGSAACLPYAPFDPGLCRSGALSSESDLVREELGSLLVPEDLSDELRRCSEAGVVRLEGDLATADITPLEGLRAVRSLEARDTRGLSSLGAFGALEAVRQDLVLSGNEGLSRLGLDRLRSVERALVFERNLALPRCAARELLGQLERPPATAILSGGIPCASDEIPPGFVIAPASAVLGFEASTAERLLVVRGGRSLSIQDLSGAMVATATAPEGSGAMVSTTPEGTLRWAVFLGGEWPISGADDGPRVRLTSDVSGGSVYVGWVSGRATLGVHELEGPGFWYGAVSASGRVSEPRRLLPFQAGTSPKLPVALAPRPGGGFVFAFRAGSAFGLAPVEASGEVGTSWFAPTPALEGPLELSFVRALGGARYALGARRAGPGEILLRGERLDDDAAGLVAVFDGMTGGVEFQVESGRPVGELTCVGLAGDDAIFLSEAPERLQLGGGRSPERHVDLPAGVRAASLVGPECRLDADPLFTGASALDDEAFTWRLGRLGAQLVVEDVGLFRGDPAAAHFSALPDGGAALATPVADGLALGEAVSLETDANAVIVLGRSPLQLLRTEP